MIHTLYVSRYSHGWPEYKIRQSGCICALDFLQSNLDNLGISAKLFGESYCYRIEFKSEEDLNLFKLLGNIKPYGYNNRGILTYQISPL